MPSGTAVAPQRAPSSDPAIAATVSVSPPDRAASRSASARCSHAFPRDVTGVELIAANAAWKAATTHPLFEW